MSYWSDLPASPGPDAFTGQCSLRARHSRTLAGGITLFVHVLLVVLFLWQLGPSEHTGLRAAAKLVSVQLVAAAPVETSPDLPVPKPPPVTPPPPRLIEPPSLPVVQASPAPLPPTDQPKPNAISPPTEQTPPPPVPAEPPRAQAPAQPTPAAPAAQQATAPTQAAPNSLTRNAGQASWESQVLAHLERNKRYPAAARLRRQEDVVYVRFSVTRQGQVSGARVVRSQGFPLLDEEVLNLLRRAVPLPPMPPEVPGESVELQVPVEFFMRGG